MLLTYCTALPDSLSDRQTDVYVKETRDSDDRASVLHSEMAPDLLKVRPTMNLRSLLTPAVSGVPYMLVRGEPHSNWLQQTAGTQTLSFYGRHSFVLFLHLPVTNFSRNYFSFVQVSFF